MEPPLSRRVLAVAVGNSRLRAALFGPEGVLVQAVAGLDESPDQAMAGLGCDGETPRVLIASVNDAAARAVEGWSRRVLGVEPRWAGRDFEVPIERALDDDRTVGQDRLLCALAAFNRLKQACVVVDAGTAITVDFVDGAGVFQGGLIAPGVRMMLRSLHEGTAALPDLAYERPDPARGPFGKDTRHAMLLGVTTAARGLVRLAVDTFAEAYGGYPAVVATGGDSAALFDGDPLVDRLVPELQLLGLRDCAAVLWVDGD
jgi:type III pantothenate kinase